MRQLDNDDGVKRVCPIARNIALYNIEKRGERTIMCGWHEKCNSRDKDGDPECTEEGVRQTMKKGVAFYRTLGKKTKK